MTTCRMCGGAAVDGHWCGDCSTRLVRAWFVHDGLHGSHLADIDVRAIRSLTAYLRSEARAKASLLDVLRDARNEMAVLGVGIDAGKALAELREDRDG